MLVLVITLICLFSFSFVIWLPRSDIIYYWGSSAGYQPGKWNNVNKKWVCGSPLSRDSCLLALQQIIMWERQLPGQTDGLKSWITSLYFVLRHCHVQTLQKITKFGVMFLPKNDGLDISEKHRGVLKASQPPLGSTYVTLKLSTRLFVCESDTSDAFSHGGNNVIMIFPYSQRRWIWKMQMLTRSNTHRWLKDFNFHVTKTL